MGKPVVAGLRPRSWLTAFRSLAASYDTEQA